MESGSGWCFTLWGLGCAGRTSESVPRGDFCYTDLIPPEGPSAESSGLRRRNSGHLGADDSVILYLDGFRRLRTIKLCQGVQS